MLKSEAGDPRRMRPSHVLLAVLVTAVWGVNFTVIEVGLDHFPPLLFSALRFLVAALPAVFLVGRPKVAWKWIVGVGLALGVAKFGLLFVGMNAGMPGGLSSLVLQIQITTGNSTTSDPICRMARISTANDSRLACGTPASFRPRPINRA